MYSSNEEFESLYETFYSKDQSLIEQSDSLLISEVSFFKSEFFSVENFLKFSFLLTLVMSPLLLNQYPAFAKTVDDIIQKKSLETITLPDLYSNSLKVGKIIDYRPKKGIKSVKILDDVVSFTKLTKLLKKLEKNPIFPLFIIKEKFPIPVVSLISEEGFQMKTNPKILIIQKFAHFSQNILLYKTLSIIRGGFENNQIFLEEKSFLTRSKENLDYLKIRFKDKLLEIYLYFKKHPERLILLFVAIVALYYLSFYSFKLIEIRLLKGLEKPEKVVNNDKTNKNVNNLRKGCKLGTIQSGGGITNKHGLCPANPDRQKPTIYQKLHGFDPETQTPNRKFIQDLLKVCEEKIKKPEKKYWGKKRK